MKQVTLPLFSSSDTIDAALVKLRADHRSGLVVDDGALYLIFAGDLLRAKDEGRVYLGEVTEREVLPAPQMANTAEPELAGAGAGWTSFESLTTRSLEAWKPPPPPPPPYSGYRVARDAAEVITSHEYLADVLEAPGGGFRCTGPVTHYFPRPMVACPGPCPLCVTPPGHPEPQIVRG